MGRGGYNSPTSSAPQPVSSSPCSGPSRYLSMQGRGGYNDVHDDDE